MAKTLEFGIPTGQTCTAKLFVLGAASDTVAETLGTVTEKTNDKGTATATVTVSGWHRIKVFVGSSPVAEWYADVKAADPSTTIAIDLSAVDWSQVYAPTSTVGLSGTTIATTQVVASVSGAVGSVIAGVTLADGVTHGGSTAKLRLGSTTSTPALYVTNTDTGNNSHAAYLQAGSGVTGGLGLLIDGGGTQTSLGAPGTDGMAATVIQSTLAKVEDLQSRIPAALVSGRMDASVGAMASNTLTASALASDAVTEIQSGLATPTNITAATGITVSAIGAGVITAASIAADAITAAKIADGAIDAATFAAGAINAAAIATDAIGSDEISAAAVTKIQAGLATPTNITAGTITTVTNLTNAPTAGDLTATMKASVNTEVDTALADIHLDHLLAVDYDPASKPGVATALFNEIIGSDAGVSQFTANALELAPTGGSAPTAAQVATAIWTDLLASTDFDTASSIGKLLKDNIDATISSRMATYTQPSGFLAATFPSGTIANTTNITAATGIVLAGVTHTGAVIPTVSAVTGLTASNLDATVSSRATPAQVNTEADTALADVGLTTTITGRIDAAISTRASQASLDTLDDYVDTEVAAIKSDTAAILIDTAEMQSDWTNGGRLDLILDTIAADTTTDIPGLIAALPTAASIFTSVLTTALTESYAADGEAPTLAQAIMLIQQTLTEFEIGGTTTTIRKLNGLTTAATLTLNSSTAPTSVTRAS